MFFMKFMNIVESHPVIIAPNNRRYMFFELVIKKAKPIPGNTE
ncbi:hypothetical protein JBKA6_0229 [Ichthyobacterium seriolicida]|uniref:Uncharacterized protein n=1 Tax=Ichthyobacterium seriolicida TaxID=242600 RepID=A0A1J1DWK8_9FLAO|nr:hypothetical protein JBKA6_0229 [Ichthyobacterium seriolicida]